MLSGATAESVSVVFNSKINEAVPQHRGAIRSVGVYGEKPKSKICVLRHFLKVAIEVAQQTDSGRLFQREGELE